jgi:hypothetical protein
VAEFRCDDLAEAIEAARQSSLRLLEALEEAPAADFNRDFGVRFKGYKVTIARLLEAEMKDEEVHYGQLAAFLSSGERL